MGLALFEAGISCFIFTSYFSQPFQRRNCYPSLVLPIETSSTRWRLPIIRGCLPSLQNPSLRKAHHAYNNASPSQNSQLVSPASVIRIPSPETDKNAEIRNQIYSLSMPSVASGHKPVIATPFRQNTTPLGVQPAITRANRQTRAESLAMFYAANTFYAWIDRFNFLPLISWVKCITSNPKLPPPKVRVELRLMHKMSCYVDLEKFARAWRDLRHETVHVRVKTAFSYLQPLSGWGSRRQCEAVVHAINEAEGCKKGGRMYGSVVMWQRQTAWYQECLTSCHGISHDELGSVRLCSVEEAVQYT